MNLIYANETKNKIPKSIFKKILDILPLFIEIKKNGVELLLTDNKSIQALNKQYRQKDSPTDVLSFGFDEGASLGQIVISVERAEEQAKELGQSLKKELEFLFTHGLLHLLGYDHENKDDEELMLQKAYKILGRKV